ncbi:hypothetical protein RAS1_33140 [Phycisphaerae bacterium RAS1]|nr:hypothetical protein RAS1_33140 [Phycisphaerae bacterium RAS1]
MGHKADSSFFAFKKPWSRRKDTILAYYLEPYLAKVRRLGRPVLLVDGFAGPGKYGDGETGSPSIMCEKARSAMEVAGPTVEVWGIERDAALHRSLESNLSEFHFFKALSGAFDDYVARIRGKAKTHTTFVYVDPFSASAIDLNRLTQLAAPIAETKASVELLLNFNTPIFVRCALAALKRHVPPPVAGEEDVGESYEPGDSGDSPVDLDGLDQITGGNWWRDAMSERLSFGEKIDQVVAGIERQLRQRFAEMCWVGIKAKQEHPIPKYHMFFGSRHPDALELMNDAMVKARGASDFEVDMFASQEIDPLIIGLAARWLPRRELMLGVVRRAFCRCFWKDIRGRIEVLLKQGQLVSESGKKRINDETRVKQADGLRAV